MTWDAKTGLREMLTTALYGDHREILAAALAEIERLEQLIAFGVDMRIALAKEKDTEIEHLKSELAKRTKKREPGPDDYPPGWTLPLDHERGTP